MNGQCSIKAHKPIHRCYFNILFSLYWSEKVDKKYGELCGTRRRPFKNTFTVEVKGDSDFSHICSKCKGGYKNSWKSDIKSTLSYIPHKKLNPIVFYFLVWYIHHAQNDGGSQNEAKQHKLGTAKPQDSQSQSNDSFLIIVFLLWDSKLPLRTWLQSPTSG